MNVMPSHQSVVQIQTAATQMETTSVRATLATMSATAIEDTVLITPALVSRVYTVCRETVAVCHSWHVNIVWMKHFFPLVFDGSLSTPCILDVNECSQHPAVCGPNSECNNKAGDYECSCHSGYNETNPSSRSSPANPCKGTVTSEKVEGESPTLVKLQFPKWLQPRWFWLHFRSVSRRWHSQHEYRM